ncbi:MAG TPA: GFA family protein [Methylomirabilota bacterium]|nr:GFA family protein [Methylomirabilota bacterium]
MASETTTMAGGCSCGAVRYNAAGAPKWASHCHCRDCRRTSGAPYVTYAGFATSQLTWSGEAPRRYASSPGVIRSYCGKCGTPLAYQGERWPDEVHILAGTLDDPGAIRPQVHVYVGEKVPWVHLSDGLPRYRTLPRDGGPLTD